MDKASHKIAVLTVDGPGGVGKGAVSMRLASKLGWHYLDSGIHYRIAAWLSLEYAETGDALVKRFVSTDFVMRLVGEALTVFVDGEDVTEKLRSEACSQMASKVSQIKEIRMAMLDVQRRCACAPGLVTDGRDMGTVVFPDALIKIYLDADLDERAKRRYKQLNEKGNRASIAEVLAEMSARDQRDSQREHAPLKPAEDALLIDTTSLSIDEVVEKIVQIAHDRLNER